jgi:probable phosphoglycerate mutase
MDDEIRLRTMTRLYLLRHAIHDLIGKALAGRMAGVHLGRQGRQQADRLAGHFATQPIAAVFSSPLERCLETVESIAVSHKLAVEPVEALNEIDCGEWTGKSFETLHDDPRWHVWNKERGRSGTPGGETTAAVQSRVMAWVEQLACSDAGPTIAVTHSDLIKIVVATLLNSPLDWHDRLTVDPASIATIDLWPGGGKIVRLNEAVTS